MPEFSFASDTWRAGIVTRNQTMEECLAALQVAARKDSCILIIGQPGSGKRLVAQAAHRASRRSNREVTLLNCSRLPVGLLEDTIAQGRGAGTVVLERISDLSERLQERLLDLLTRPVDSRARVVSTSRPDVRDVVSQGRFRIDLFHKLSTICIELPVLSQRRDDIPLLIANALETTYRETGVRRFFSPKAIELLAGAEYPGNVSQLRAVVRQAVLVSHSAVVSADTVERVLGSGAAPITERYSCSGRDKVRVTT